MTVGKKKQHKVINACMPERVKKVDKNTHMKENMHKYWYLEVPCGKGFKSTK